ncbi:hypothetical protein IYY11_21275 [Methylocystis sp. H62]|uniref:hypothetical protein n=1 Tax=Methylocystis sp. H62 TaxID=2785789 RepID=UPI0018C1FC89|nr:hypothetical protein [Methylocystis sp. H62]MBG0795893.1 hypothetical protein [Methylocystis sp. H62]
MTDYPDFTHISYINRASSILGEFMERDRRQKNALANAMIFAADKVAEHSGVQGGFLGPFDINALATIGQMGALAEEISELFVDQRDAAGFMGCCSYAAISVMCFLRAGRYHNDPAAAELATLVVELFGTAKAARD